MIGSIISETLPRTTNLFFVLDNPGEISLKQVSVGSEHLDHGFSESLHVSVPDGGVLTLELLEDLEALGELSEDVHHGRGEVAVLCVLPEPVLLVPVIGAVQELQGDVVILVEPLHHESLEPLRVLWDLALVGRDVRHVGLVEPLDPEVAVEIGRGLAEPVLLVLLQGQLDVGGEEAPHGGGGELKV